MTSSQASRSRAARIARVFRTQGFRVGTTTRSHGLAAPGWVLELFFRPGGASTDEVYELGVRDEGSIGIRDRTPSYPSSSRDGMMREMASLARAVK